MKRIYTAHPRAIALLMAAVALPATPALAQDAAPPPVATTVPAPAPTATPDAAPAAAQAPVFAPRQEVVQPLPARPTPPNAAEEAAPAPAPRARAEQPRRTARPAAERAPAVVPAPVAATPVTPLAVTPAPVTSTAAPAPVPEAMPPETTATDTATATETTTTSSIPWLWIGFGVIALAALALLFGRRKPRVEDEYYAEPVAVAPHAADPVIAPVVAPTIAQPVLTPAVHRPVERPVEPVAATSEDDRPWIGLSIWPKHVDNDGNVEYDLVVENAGDIEAHDVRVSSFMIDGTNSSPMESALIGDADTRSVDVRAGASVQIAQTVTVADGVSPRIVAEARYPLPGGGEGHIAARFAIDTDKDGTVEARLDDLLERV